MNKFSIAKAKEVPPETTVLVRSDGESMHGNQYMVVNCNKPYALLVYSILRNHGIEIPFTERKLTTARFFPEHAELTTQIFEEPFEEKNPTSYNLHLFDDKAQIVPIKDFRSLAHRGIFMCSDGEGFLATANQESDIDIFPALYQDIDPIFTYVAWYEKNDTEII